MQKLVLFILLSTCTICCFSQDNKKLFPEKFLGIYKGDIVINSSKETQNVPMEFHLKKTDSLHKFKYIIIYDKTPRDYTLIVRDLEKGIYDIDENNGIILPAKFANNTLYSFFEVNDNFLSSRLEFKVNSIDFEILFSSTKEKTATGGMKGKSPKVFGFPITTVQKAVLIKQ